MVAAHAAAAEAGATMLRRGGSAADAAVAAGAVMAVTGPHLCGLGGDMLAMVSPPPGEGPPVALLGVGRAGSGSDPDRLRSEGHRVMPLRGDLRSVPVPGAVDGWTALHARFGRLPLGEVLEPAVALATDGFGATMLLALASSLVAGVPGAEELCPDGPLVAGQTVRLPGVARVLQAVADRGRDGFYRGVPGRALLAMGGGLYTEADLARPLADWHAAVRLRAWGHDLWTVPAPSQGYLTLAAAAVAERAGLPTDPADPRWIHVLVEAARAVGHDRPACLHEGADTQALLSEERLARAAARIDPARAAPPDVPAPGGPAGPAVRGLGGDGDTTHLCALSDDGMGVSLTQSNALDFGAHLVAGDSGVFLHDRGVGFSLEPGHPAELAPGRRPPHTLSPALVTRPDGALAVVLGTMGGDGQPQILAQLLARLLHAGQDAPSAVGAPRAVLDAPSAGPFRLWWGDDLSVVVEADAPDGWVEGLRRRGHQVRTVRAQDPVAVGCAQLITTGAVPGAGADPRSADGGAASG